MRLCEKCVSERDWKNDPVVRTKIELNAQAPEERRARCATCRCYIRNPLFILCESCAGAHEQCQRCSTSTVPPEERAARERIEMLRENLIDLFTLLVKTYGLTAARRLFHRHADQFGPAESMVPEIVALNAHDLDYGRERRPIWKKVLGPDVCRFRFCVQCPHPERLPPSLTAAKECGHLTAGADQAWCPLCAADRNACETCGSPVT